MYGTTVYNFGIIAQHNVQRLPNAGSCIFLHEWAGPGQPTAGCIAMAASNLRVLGGWFIKNQSPHILILTESDYSHVARLCKMPPLECLRTKGESP